MAWFNNRGRTICLSKQWKGGNCNYFPSSVQCFRASQIWMKKIHIVEHWRMLSFCKIPSSFPPFIKPCPSLSHPPHLISSRLLPRFQAKQKHMLRRHRKWRWGRDPPPARAPAGRRPVPSAAWSGSQNLPKGETGNTRGGYRARSETGGWPLIKGTRDEEKMKRGRGRK